MEENITRGSAIKSLVGKLCFIIFGVSALSNPLNRYNIFNIAVGLVIGLIFGGFFKKLLNTLLSSFNKQLKNEKGKETIQFAVNNAMLFLVPFAFMTLLATFYLKWTMTGGFISAGIMAVGTAASIEIGKLKDKQEIKNTIITSVVSFLFSYIWTYLIGYFAKAPGLVECVVSLIRSIVSKGGGAI